LKSTRATKAVIFAKPKFLKESDSKWKQAVS